MVERGAAGLGIGPDETPASDGRRRRRQQSRQRIIEALLEALGEPDFDLSPEQTAVRSGEQLAAGPFEGDVRARTRELVRRLAAAFETVAPTLRSVQPDRQKSVGDRGRRRLDATVRDQIGAALGPELADLPADTTDLLATVLSVSSWSHMRTTHGHDAERSAALLESAVLRLLGEQPEAWG